MGMRYIDLNCTLSESARDFLLDTDNEFKRAHWLREVKAVVTAETYTFIVVASRLTDTIQKALAKASMFAGGKVLDPTGEYGTLFESILQPALLSVNEIKDDADTHDIDQCFADKLVERLHLAFYLRVDRAYSVDITGYGIWDCVESSLYDWVQLRQRMKYNVEVIEPEWTTLKPKDAGLLLIDHFIPVVHLSQTPSFTPEHSVTVKSSAVGEFKERSEKRQLQRVLSTTTMRRLSKADLVNSRVTEIAWSFTRYFSECLPHACGGSFVEFHLMDALTSLEGLYKTAGASAAFKQFTDVIAGAISQAFYIEAVSVDTGEKWRLDAEPLSVFLARQRETEIKFDYTDKPLHRQIILPIARHIFSRPAMLMWRVPLPGAKSPGYCYGEELA